MRSDKKTIQLKSFSLFMQFPGTRGAWRARDIPASQRAEESIDDKDNLCSFTIVLILSNQTLADVNITITCTVQNPHKGHSSIFKPGFPSWKQYLAINFVMFVPIWLNIYCRH